MSPERSAMRRQTDLPPPAGSTSALAPLVAVGLYAAAHSRLRDRLRTALSTPAPDIRSPAGAGRYVVEVLQVFDAREWQ